MSGESRLAPALDAEQALRALIGVGCDATVYVALVGEAVDAWRPISARCEGDGLYRLSDRVPCGERWAFPPGSLVRCEPRCLGGTSVVVAVSAAD